MDRFIYTDKYIDFTVIEILKEDNITNFLEIDEFINSKDYINIPIFSCQLLLGEKVKYSHGIHLGTYNKYFLYSIEENKGFWGSPIILLNNNKLIGLFKAKYYLELIDSNRNKNIGIPMNIIISKINYIKCTYKIDRESIGKEIKLIDINENKEIVNKIKIMKKCESKSNLFKIDKEGNYTFYIMIENSLTNMSEMFYKCKNLEKIDLSKIKADNITDISRIFLNCSLLKEIYFSSFQTNNVKSMSGMFCGCCLLKKIDLSLFRTNNVTKMESMFAGCHSLEKINLSSFQTDNVTSMAEMFLGCKSLKDINLSNFNTDKVTDMSVMFYGCFNLEKINLSSFKGNKVNSILGMFFGCISLKEINLSSFHIYDKIKVNDIFERGVFDNVPISAILICNDDKLKIAFFLRRNYNRISRISFEDYMCGF